MIASGLEVMPVGFCESFEEHLLLVDGMSCTHCTEAVRQAVAALDGVRRVKVDLDSGEVSVVGSGQTAREDIVGAIQEAGYEIRR